MSTNFNMSAIMADTCPECNPKQFIPTTTTFTNEEDDDNDERRYSCSNCNAQVWIDEDW